MSFYDLIIRCVPGAGYLPIVQDERGVERYRGEMRGTEVLALIDAKNWVEDYGVECCPECGAALAQNRCAAQCRREEMG
jgi:hypothetical protein